MQLTKDESPRKASRVLAPAAVVVAVLIGLGAVGHWTGLSGPTKEVTQDPRPERRGGLTAGSRYKLPAGMMLMKPDGEYVLRPEDGSAQGVVQRLGASATFKVEHIWRTSHLISSEITVFGEVTDGAETYSHVRFDPRSCARLDEKDDRRER